MAQRRYYDLLLFEIASHKIKTNLTISKYLNVQVMAMFYLRCLGGFLEIFYNIL